MGLQLPPSVRKPHGANPRDLRSWRDRSDTSSRSESWPLLSCELGLVLWWWKQVKSWATSSLRCQWTNDVDYIDVDDDDDDDGPFRRCFLYNYDCKEKKKHRHTHRQDARPHRLDRTGAAPQPVPGNLWLFSQKVSWCLKYPPTKKTVISNSHPKSPPIFNPSHETNSGYLFGVATQAQTSGRDLAIWWADGGYMVDINPSDPHFCWQTCIFS